jgi:c-di-GMP-binding flagellar brake protein YcgR
MIHRKQPEAAGTWRQGEGGYEKTSSLEIISGTLARLKEKRSFIALFHQGYQSGNTMLIGIDSTSLLIDKPIDWPGISQKIRVVFKDESNVRNHFTVQVVNATEDTLKTEFPTELFRLQRRKHFRIAVPRGSHASFYRKGALFADASVINISAGGMLLGLKENNPIVGASPDDSIKDIAIRLGGIAEESAEKSDSIIVYRGRIVREYFDGQTGKLMLGIELIPQKSEEKELFEYVRKRELEILRKGVKK